MLDKKSNFWAWMLIFVCFVWGIEFSLVHQALNDLGPHSFNAVRFLIAAITLQLYFQYKSFRWTENCNKNTFYHGIVLGSMLFAGFATQSIGLQYTSASIAGFITGLNVVFVPIVCFIWLRQTMPWYVWLGVLLATLGTALLTGISSVDQMISGHLRGELWVLLCAFSFAIHIVYTGIYTQQANAYALTQVQMLTVTLLSLMAALVFEDRAIQTVWHALFVNSSGIAWLALIIGGTLGTGLAYVAQTIGQQYLAAWRVALIFATEPLFAALGGYWLLSETLTTLAWLGAVLIIAGMLIAELVGDSSAH